MVQRKYTPLHWAAMNEHSESVQLLLAAKGNVNAEAIVSSPPCANIMELCSAELRGVDWCRTSPPRYTGLLIMVTVSQCSYSSLLTVIQMRRQMSVPPPPNMMELCGAELCGLDWYRSTKKPRYTRLLEVKTANQCSYSSLLTVIRMWKTL